MIHAKHYLVVRKITKQTFFVCGAANPDTLCREGDRCKWIETLPELANGGARDYKINLCSNTDGERTATIVSIGGQTSVVGDSRLFLFDTTLAVIPVELVRNTGGVYEWVPEVEKSVDVSSTSGWSTAEGDHIYLTLDKMARRELISETAAYSLVPW